MLSEPGLTYPVVYGESQKTESEMYSDILPSTVVRSEDVHYPDSERYLPSHTHSSIFHMKLLPFICKIALTIRNLRTPVLHVNCFWMVFIPG